MKNQIGYNNKNYIISFYFNLKYEQNKFCQFIIFFFFLIRIN